MFLKSVFAQILIAAVLSSPMPADPNPTVAEKITKDVMSNAPALLQGLGSIFQSLKPAPAPAPVSAGALPSAPSTIAAPPPLQAMAPAQYQAPMAPQMAAPMAAPQQQQFAPAAQFPQQYPSAAQLPQQYQGADLSPMSQGSSQMAPSMAGGYAGSDMVNSNAQFIR